MITVFVSPSCSSCRKVKKYFDDNHIEYTEKNIFSPDLTEKDIYDVITKCENGTDDIISRRSKIVSEQNIDFDSMKLSELIAFIRKNPSVLKRPIIVDDRRVQVGYNEEDITTFIPRARQLASLFCNPTDCPRYSVCEHALDNKEDGRKD